MTADQREVKGKRTRVRVQSRKRTRYFLLALGFTGLAAGAWLLIQHWRMGIPKLRAWGIIYILVSCIILLAQGLMRLIYLRQRRKYSE